MPKSALKQIAISKPVLTVLPYVLIAAGIVFGFWWVFKKGFPNVANFVTDPQNSVNQSFQKVYSAVTGSTQPVGADIYDLLHSNAGQLPKETIEKEQAAVAKFNQQTGLSAASYDDIIKYRNAGIVRLYDTSKTASAPGNYWVKLNATDPKDTTPVNTGNVWENVLGWEYWRCW